MATLAHNKAVTKFPNQDDAFLEVTKAIHAAAEALSAAQRRGGQESTEGVSTGPSSNPISGTRKPKAAIGSWGPVRDVGYELPRISLLGTWVNKASLTRANSSRVCGVPRRPYTRFLHLIVILFLPLS
jgi:hypothetical protein